MKGFYIILIIILMIVLKIFNTPSIEIYLSAILITAFAILSELIDKNKK